MVSSLPLLGGTRYIFRFHMEQWQQYMGGVLFFSISFFNFTLGNISVC
jgi:hypothetical protein